MQQLLEDYERRLKSINSLIAMRKDASLAESVRWNTKAACFRTFINELKISINNQNKSK